MKNPARSLRKTSAEVLVRIHGKILNEILQENPREIYRTLGGRITGFLKILERAPEERKKRFLYSCGKYSTIIILRSVLQIIHWQEKYKK